MFEARRDLPRVVPRDVPLGVFTSCPIRRILGASHPSIGARFAMTACAIQRSSRLHTKNPDEPTKYLEHASP